MYKQCVYMYAYSIYTFTHYSSISPMMAVGYSHTITVTTVQQTHLISITVNSTHVNWSNTLTKTTISDWDSSYIADINVSINQIANVFCTYLFYFLQFVYIPHKHPPQSTSCYRLSPSTHHDIFLLFLLSQWNHSQDEYHPPLCM